MCKKFHFCVLSFSLFFGALANANDRFCGLDSCRKEALSPYFIKLNLKPIIENNGDLLANLLIEYGQDFVDDLIKKNSLLSKKPDGKIDKTTLKWIKKVSFLNKHSPGVKYIIAPFPSPSNNYGADVLLQMLIPGLYPTFKSRPVFLNADQLNAVITLFKDKDFEMPRNFIQKHFNLNAETTESLVYKIYNVIFKKKDYIMGNELKNIENHTLIIAAHGSPADEFIEDDPTEIHFSEVANILKDIGIPNNINIEIGSCCSAVGLDSMNTGKTKDELIDLFIDKKIIVIAGDMKNSFAYKFSKEIYSKLPQFSGSVTGYTGTYYAHSNYSYLRDPKKPNTVITEEIPSISVLDINNKDVFFDKSEMAVEYKRNDFP